MFERHASKINGNEKVIDIYFLNIIADFNW